jgi:hypothetical protein
MKRFLALALLLVVAGIALAQSPVVLFFRGAGVPQPTLLPSDFPTLAGWWVASDLALSDGEPVTNWVSRVNDYTLTNQAGTTVPIYKTSGFSNGYPSVRFITEGGSNQTMKLTNIMVINAGGAVDGLLGLSMIVVGTHTNIGITMHGANGSGYQFIVNQSGINKNWAFYNGSFADATFGYPQTVPRVDHIGRTNAAWMFLQNLTNATVGPISTLAAFKMDTLVLPAGLTYNANIVEICIYTNYMLTSTEYTNLYHRYFRFKYPFLPDVP